MSKLTLTDITSGYASITKLNSNNDLIEAAIENTLSRDGTGPNQMNASLDMNNRRILNLPNAISNGEPVTLSQAASIAGVTNPLTQNSVAAVLYPQTSAEVSAGVTPSNYAIPSHDYTGTINPERYGTNSSPGSTNMYTALNTAKSVAAQASGAAIGIYSKLYIDTSITLGYNLVFKGAGQLKPASGVTITINGEVDAGQWQIFDCSSGGSIAGLKTTTYRWFGAVGDGATNDTTVIGKAYDSMVRGTIKLGQYDYLATNIKIKPKLTLEGEGIEVTTLRLSGANTLITSDVTNNSYCGIKRLTMRGDGTTAGQKLLNVTGPYASYFEQVFFSSAENLLELSEIEGQTVFRDCYFTFAGNAGYCIRLNNVREVIFDNSPIENARYGVYATRTNAVYRLKFNNIHVENVGKVFDFVGGSSYTGGVYVGNVDANNVGANLTDPTTGFFCQIDSENALFENLWLIMSDANTPVIKTTNWSIYARDCPSYSGVDSLVAYIPRFEVGYNMTYIPCVKQPILDTTVTLANLYTQSGSVAVSTAGGTGAFTSTGTGQWRIRPLTTAVIADRPIMIQFEYKATLTSAITVNIDSMSSQMLGYSGSTINRSGTTFQLPTTAGAWTKAYVWVRYRDEFNQSSRFFFGSLPSGDTIEFRNFAIHFTDRPPYSLKDW